MSSLTALAENLDANLSERSLPIWPGLSSHSLEACNVLSLKALRALLHFELHRLTFVEGLVTVHNDGGEVHEDIFSRLALDEPVAFRSIEPLHCSLFLHCPTSHARPRSDRDRRYWNCIASLDPFLGDREAVVCLAIMARLPPAVSRSEEHTSELQSQFHLVCRLLLEKKNLQEIPRAVQNGKEHSHDPN